MKAILSLAGVALLLALSAPVPAAGQSASDPASDARFRFGPVGVSPRITLGNIGVDTNVFNQADQPTRDFTISFLPGADAWLPVGRSVFSSQTTVELIYFQKASSQRSVGYSQQARFDLHLVHLTPYATGGYVSTYQRPNAEIDARVQRTTSSGGFGTSLRLGARTSIELSALAMSEQYAKQQYLGVDLNQALSRRALQASLAYRVVLTPLTTFVVRNTFEQDRFAGAPERNGHSESIVPGLEFTRDALISGSASVGYRRFQPARSATPSFPGFSGLVASMSLSYVARDATRLSGTVDRNVDYSFGPNNPYFIVTGATLSINQMIVGRLDALLRAGLQHLSYRTFESTPAQAADENRRDRTRTYGTGIGYRLQSGARVGFNVTYNSRHSAIDGRQYKGFQFGGSFTYGF